MKFFNLKSGYSIVEIIIYVAVFAVVSIVIANAFIVLFSFFNQTRTNHDLLGNGNTALERISYEVKNAKSILGTSVFGTSPGVLVLDSVDENGNPQTIQFDVSNGALQLSKDGVLVGNILGPNIQVVSLIFYKVSTENSSVVNVEMTLQDTRDKIGLIEKFNNVIVLPKKVDDAVSGSTSRINLVYDGIHAGSDGFNFQRQMNYVGNIYSAGYLEQQHSGANVTVTGSIYSSFATAGWPDISGGDMWNPLRLVVQGDTYGDVVNYTQANGALYCQSGYGNNKACDTSKPSTVVDPIPDWTTNITEWKAKAAAGGNCNLGVYNYPYPALTLGPCKVDGPLSIYGNLTLTGPIWTTGTFRLIGGGIIVKPDVSYASNDEVIISDSQMIIGNFSNSVPSYFQGSGTGDSNILFISLHNGYSSIELGNLEGNALFYSPNGTIVAVNKNKNKSIIAKGVSFSGTPGTVDTIEHISGTTSLDIGKGVFSVTP